MDASIIKKIRFSQDAKSAIINAPIDFYKSFCNLSETNHISKSLIKNPGWILVFVFDKSDVDRLTPGVLETSDEKTILWFAYPKKSSSIKTDITRDKGWDSVHNNGWEGVSIISIDDTWSAFRARPQKASRAGTPSDASVKAATGKIWKEWYKELNDEGAKDITHQEIAKLLRKKYSLDGWWSQMLTNSYEQYIGRREKHQMADGFQASVSRTFGMPVSKAYKSFFDEKMRGKWLKDPGFQISTSRENRSIRALWVDRMTRISVDFYEKGDNKCQVVVQHLKIPTSDECEVKKAYWKENLEKLFELSFNQDAKS